MRRRAQSRYFARRTTCRWRLRFGEEPLIDGPRCAECVFFVELTSRLSAVWGVCANAEASANGRVVLREGGCPAFTSSSERTIDSAGWFERGHRYPLRATGEYLDVWLSDECGACSYCVHALGRMGNDWGVCCNPDSPLDGVMAFEHDGCEGFERSDGAPRTQVNSKR